MTEYIKTFILISAGDYRSWRKPFVLYLFRQGTAETDVLFPDRFLTLCPRESCILSAGQVFFYTEKRIQYLALPGRLADTESVLRWYKENLDGRALLSLMTQYTPIPGSPAVPFPDRFTEQEEYGSLLALLEQLDIGDGFLQELNPDDEWLPDFSREQPFSSDLARPVWHWKTGFLPAVR